jgi:heme A synthase
LWALVAGTLVLWTSVRIFRLAAKNPRLSRLALILAVTVIAQITLGALTVISAKAIDVTTAHVALGAFLLAMSVLTTLHVARAHSVTVRASSPAVSREALA